MTKVRVGRKFIAFLLCLIALIVMGVLDKGTGIAPFIIALYASYVTGNVTQKATAKSDDTVTMMEHEVTVEADK